MKKELNRLNTLIAQFRAIADQYPTGNYGDHAAKLEKERAELVSKIGRK
jgi:hypothetical protein